MVMGKNTTKLAETFILLQLHAFLTSAVDGNESLGSRTGRLNPWKEL